MIVDSSAYSSIASFINDGKLRLTAVTKAAPRELWRAPDDCLVREVEVLNSKKDLLSTRVLHSAREVDKLMMKLWSGSNLALRDYSGFKENVHNVILLVSLSKLRLH